MTTIKEVGARAGVSASTVSNVLNGRGHVAEATRDKVLDVVRELGYKANIHAQQLVTQRSRILAIKLPDLGDMGGVGIPNSTYFLNVVNGATEVANDLDYALVVLPSKADPRALRRFGIDGFIVVDPSEDEPILRERAPVVTIGASQNLSGPAGQVDNDHAAALLIAIAEFSRHGRKRHAIVKDSTHRPYVESIGSAYLEWASRNGVTPNVFELQNLEPSRIDALLRSMARMGVDSVYAASDDIAVALLKRAQETGLAVPERLAIISAVDSLALTLTSPGISAMEMYPLRAGEAALRLLVKLLEEGGGSEPGEVAIPVAYVSRGTC